MTETDEVKADKEIPVLYITTDLGQRYTCRTVEDLDTFMTNFKKDHPNPDLQISLGRMKQSEYNKIQLSKYFTKT